MSRAAYVVTGAATGIGQAVARRLVAEGAVVVGVDADADGLAGLEESSAFTACAGDVRQQDTLENAADSAERSGSSALG